MVRPDKHFLRLPEGVLCLWGVSRNDLEGLPAGAGQPEKRRGFAQRKNVNRVSTMRVPTPLEMNPAEFSIIPAFLMKNPAETFRNPAVSGNNPADSRNNPAYLQKTPIQKQTHTKKNGPLKDRSLNYISSSISASNF